MKSRSAEKLADAQPIPVYIVPAVDDDIEISLADLWGVIARHKGIVLASMFAAVLAGATYLFFVQPVYRATAHLLPPKRQDIQELQIDYRGTDMLEVKQYTPESVYTLFLHNLRSQGLRREFFDDHSLVKHYVAEEAKEDVNVDRIFDTQFNESLRVQVDKQDPSFVTVSFSDSSPQLAAQLLNEMIEFTNQRTTSQLVSDVNGAIQAAINQVRYHLASKLKLAEQRRSDTITGLKEALRVARSLGIQTVSTSSRIADHTQSGFTINTAQLPLYMRGVDALEAEILMLESRKSEEPFISGLRDLQERRAFLEGISLNPGKLSSVTMDAAARMPYRADNARKSSVILVAVILGIIVGVVVAFFAEFLSRFNRKTDRQAD